MMLDYALRPTGIPYLKSLMFPLTILTILIKYLYYYSETFGRSYVYIVSLKRPLIRTYTCNTFH